MNKHSMRRARYHQYLALFLMGVLLYLITVLPFIIYHGGIFFYYGDYNVQQVPFYVLGNRIVRSGNLFWTPSIDLGTSWLGSFAMYLSGSPYFYLSVLFPESWVPYLMPFFMSLKFGTALATSYAYAQTLVPSKAKPDRHATHIHALTSWNQGALIAALLYTFSGWSQTNIVFQHFHEAYAFYPLYLLLFDRYILLSRSAVMRTDAIITPVSQAGCAVTGAHTQIHHKASLAGLAFSLMTAFMAILNYYFFCGQVLFLILYYLMRYVIGAGRSLRQILTEILRLLARGLLGVCLAAFFLVQVYDMLSGNTRLADTISGLDMIVYEGRSTPLAILKSLFYLPDLVGRGTLFTNEQIKNSAPALYLPLFAASGVIAYCMARRLREDWIERLLIVCAVIAYVPVLNSAFNMFNAEYYSRWYYMPILFMSIATVQMLAENDIPHLRRGAWITIAAFLLITLCVLLPCYDEDGNLVHGQMVEYMEIYVVQLLVTAVFMAVLLLVVCILPSIARRSEAASPSICRRSADAVTDTVTTPSTATAAATAVTADTVPTAAADTMIAQDIDVSASLQTTPDAQGGVTSYRLLQPWLVVLVAIACVVSTIATLYGGNTIIARSGGVKWRHQLLEQAPTFRETGNANAARQTSSKEDLPDDSAEAHGSCWYRVETDGSSTNYELVWGLPTIHSFQSTVPGGLFDFYHGIGYNRTVNTKLSFARVGARALTSVRYHLENALVSTDNNYSDYGGMPGYTCIGQSDGYNIYEQEHFIPMGFTFDACISEDLYALTEETSDIVSDRLLVRDLILSSADVKTYGHLFDTIDTDIHLEAATDEEFLADCNDRAAAACTYFAYTETGFEAVSDNDDEELVFFSVPYDEGFTAYVDGAETPIIRADYGLMAVDVPAGEHEITFTYRPAHLSLGIAGSIAAAVILILVFCIQTTRTNHH